MKRGEPVERRLAVIRERMEHGNYIVSFTHTEKLRERKIGAEDIEETIRNGAIIEDYPDDNPYPSCLIYGNTFSQEPVHSVWAYNQKNRWAVVITVYRPDPQRWIDWRTRRPKDDAIQ